LMASTPRTLPMSLPLRTPGYRKRQINELTNCDEKLKDALLGIRGRKSWVRNFISYRHYFLCRDPGAGFAPSCLGECAIAARHEPEHRTMWYRKNVGGWERAARLIGGGLMLICGVVALHASPLGLLLSGAGVVTLVTGVFGYCPACAIAGRDPLKG
jgi:DUF2892 family protein